MSYKTRRLVELFPEVYNADDPESLLYKLLDTFGAELMEADERVKLLLKSHWLNYAQGEALDGLGAVFGVSRRILRTGAPESDEAFRTRLRNTVELYTGGGTTDAVLMAVRSALGLPVDIDNLRLDPRGFNPLIRLLTPLRLQREAAIRQALKNLVTLEEFSPTGITFRTTPDDITPVEGAYELRYPVEVDSADVAEVRPTIRWTFTEPGRYRLVVQRELANGTVTGFRSVDMVEFAPGQSLVFSAASDGALVAVLDNREVNNLFVDLDGSQPARLPDVPPERHVWVFRNEAGRYDATRYYTSRFGRDSFDPAGRFIIEMAWLNYKPLTFTVTMPYRIEDAVQQIKRDNGYTGDLFIYDGLPLERIPEVVDQSRAAGVQANVQFVLNGYENHVMQERLTGDMLYDAAEDHPMQDDLLVGSETRLPETHTAEDRFMLGGVFNVAQFDSTWGYAPPVDDADDE